MLASSYPRFPGDPSGIFIAALAKAVAELGVGVRVFAPADPSALPGLDAPVPVSRFGYSPFRFLQPMGYGKALENDRRLRLAARICAAPYLLTATVHLLKRRAEWDLLHLHWVLPNGPPGVLAAEALGRPVVITLHGSDVYLAAVSRLLGPLARLTLRRAAAVTACSPDHIAFARACGVPENRLYLIPWGGDPDRFPLGNGTEAAPSGQGCDERGGRPPEKYVALPRQPTQPAILALGRLVEKKGFGSLLEAVALLPDRPRVVVAGDGPMLAALKSLARRLQIEADVSFCGAVPPEAVPALMASATIIAVPSLPDGSGNQDGLPTVALEAMAAGKPVIASTLGGLPLVVQHEITGLLVAPGDVPGLAAGLRRLIEHPEQARTMGANARRVVEQRLNWRTAAEEYVAVYRRALAGRAAAPSR